MKSNVVIKLQFGFEGSRWVHAIQIQADVCRIVGHFTAYLDGVPQFSAWEVEFCEILITAPLDSCMTEGFR